MSEEDLERLRQRGYGEFWLVPQGFSGYGSLETEKQEKPANPGLLGKVAVKTLCVRSISLELLGLNSLRLTGAQSPSCFPDNS